MISYKEPNCIERLGREVLKEVPVYKRKNKLKLLYVNKELFEKQFNETYSYENAKKILEDYFSITINDELKANEKVISKAFIDKQIDPLGISMDGNIGSGRAYYIGENFNLKGELTPFATSQDPIYNNGKLSLLSAIHETLMSNVIASEIYPKSYETLALFDSNETYQFPYSNEQMECGIMIRSSQGNELFRFTHCFVNNKSFSKKDLYNLAQTLGILEGNKFTEKLLHGAWSLGNLSIDGNMIDFDTSYFTKNRNPLFSFTPKYKTNYFGFEYLGTLKIINAIVESHLNKDNIEYNQLEKLLLTTRRKQIEKELIHFMGFQNKEPNNISNLTEEFIELSRFSIESYEEHQNNHPLSENTSIFNFSNFFRNYPILKLNNTFSKIKGLKLLINENIQISDTNDHNLKKMVKANLNDYLICDEESLIALYDRAIYFIEDYDKVFEQNLKESTESLEDVAINSYLLHEDRTYLHGEENTKKEIKKLYHQYDAEYINTLITTIIDINKRNNSTRCNYKLFEEGLLCTNIKKKEKLFQFEFIPFLEDLEINLIFNHQTINLHDEGYLKSDNYSIKELLGENNLFSITNKKEELNIIGQQQKLRKERYYGL